ncbi:putative MFS transporter [Tothia fuscella]|uniref:MFS transporter n=1 Tax=Tothia fuscella TaxID=1048955 RepID=A0A9P4P4A6_9PEZI|nr:putative MFS transporter [Tothia fuscella]
MTKAQEAAEKTLHNQENFLPRKQLVLIFTVLATTLLVYFIDQNGIGQILPTVAKDLHAQQTISWAGLLCFSDLMCGLSKNAVMLYVFRGLTGIAGGGITSLSMMIVSDIVSLERRGKYQGILGSMVGLGNLIGPLLAATFAQKSNWRGLFYLLSPTAACCGFVSWYFLPGTAPKAEFRENVRLIDWWGVGTASVGLILILVPVSGGGSYFEWKSPMVISMLVIGGLFAIVFIYVEWKVSRLPMMPLSMFKNKPVAAILFQNFFFGMVFYCYLYYLPLYFQNVRLYSPIRSATLTLPLVLTQSIASILSGQYISHFKRYGTVIWFGFTLFTIGTSLTTLFTRHTPVYAIIIILIILGYGNGNCFQPTIIALQAHCPKSQRAIVISVRNFLRCLGGSVGLAVGAAVLQNVLAKELPEGFEYLAKTTYAKPDYGAFSKEEGERILDAYAKASRAVFVFLAPCAGVCLATCVFVRDRGLTREEDEVGSVADGINGEVEEKDDCSVRVDVASVRCTRSGSGDGEKGMEIEAEKVLEAGCVKAV